MLNFLRPFVSGIIASVVAGGVAWLASRGINVNQDTIAQIVEYLVGIILPVFGAVFHITNKAVAKVVNPGDAATSQLAEEHIHENEQLKAAGSNSPSVIR